MLSIKAIGFQAAARSMTKKKERLTDRRDTNAKAVIVVDRWIQKNFQSQGQPVGGWEKLKPATISARRKGGKGAKILQDAGILKTNWKHFWNARIGRIRSGVSYAVYHDSTKPRHKLPRRQILPDDKHISPELLKLYDNYVGSVVRSD